MLWFVWYSEINYGYGLSYQNSVAFTEFGQRIWPSPLFLLLHKYVALRRVGACFLACSRWSQQCRARLRSDLPAAAALIGNVSGVPGLGVTGAPDAQKSHHKCSRNLKINQK